MTVELGKTDIINMIRGVDPGYAEIDRLERLGLGYYVGGFDDRWEWYSPRSDAWEDFTDEELFEIYKELRYRELR